jgi:retron-type reverse transcriptase
MTDVKENICSFENLYRSMYHCKKNVMWKDSVAGYVKNGLVNCHNLRKQLLEDSYKIDRYNLFTIYEPKERDIVSTRIKDRVFQRSLTDNYLYAEITKSFIYDNGACQVGKGTDFSRDRLNCLMQRYYRKHGTQGWVLSCDIKNYFGSTPHRTAKEAVSRNIKDDWCKNHVHKIIDSFNQGPDPDVGMGLGSQITQLAQLSVLNSMDHMIKERLGIKYYIRYMDDFHLIHHDKEHLRYCLKVIEDHLTSLGLKLNSKKTQIYPLRQGITFLGFRFLLSDTGKIIRLLRKSNVSHERRKLKRMSGLVREGRMTKDHVDECYTSWKAHASKGTTYKLIKNMDRFYESLWEVD